jgi:hypothetical protein
VLNPVGPQEPLGSLVEKRFSPPMHAMCRRFTRKFVCTASLDLDGISAGKGSGQLP